MLTLDEVRETITNLSLPDEPFIRRRVARALMISPCDVNLTTGTVFSQSQGGIQYQVNLDSGSPSCSCPDGDRTIYCKHRIALMLAVKEEQ